MSEWLGKYAIGIRLRSDEWDLISQVKTKAGLTLYTLFQKSVEKWLNSISPDQFVSTTKGNRRDTVVWVSKEDYQKMKERAQQLKVSIGSLTREIMLKEAREILQILQTQGGGYGEKQTSTGEGTNRINQ